MKARANMSSVRGGGAASGPLLEKKPKGFVHEISDYVDKGNTGENERADGARCSLPVLSGVYENSVNGRLR